VDLILFHLKAYTSLALLLLDLLKVYASLLSLELLEDGSQRKIEDLLSVAFV